MFGAMVYGCKASQFCPAFMQLRMTLT
jgi:hypothetical protein